MLDFKIFPPSQKEPIKYNYYGGSFIPSQAVFDAFNVFTYSPSTFITSISRSENNRLHYETSTGTYNGVGHSEDEQYATFLKLEDVLKKDNEKSHFYDAYIVNRDVMYDIDANNDVEDYAKFLYENPNLVESLIIFSVFYQNIAPYNNINENELTECAQFINQLRNEYGEKLNKKTRKLKATYNQVIIMHKTLIRILHILSTIKIRVAIIYKDAKLNDIHAKDHIILKGIDFNNLHIESDEGVSNGYDYPIIGISECLLTGNIILHSTVYQLIVKWSQFDSIKSENFPILGIHFDTVNVGRDPIELPNCGQTVYICIADTVINPKHYKEMIHFSKNHVTKIFSTQKFADKFLELNPSIRMSNIPLFFANYAQSNIGSRFERLKTQFDCDAFIISDEDDVRILHYEKKINEYKELPRDMVEMLTALLSK